MPGTGLCLLWLPAPGEKNVQARHYTNGEFETVFFFFLVLTWKVVIGALFSSLKYMKSLNNYKKKSEKGHKK